MSNKTPEWMPELFFCHRHKFLSVADVMGFRLGTRADQVETNQIGQAIDNGLQIEFVDNNFKEPDKERLEKVVQITGAKYVVLPDIYDSENVVDIVRFGKRLEDKYECTPIVVPKEEFDFHRLPDNWILGFSVPSGYAETEVEIKTFKTHRIHLLGGSPRKQIEYANKAVDNGVEIFSIDGNCFSKASGYGNIINEPVEIIDKNGKLDGKAWVSDADGYTDWGQRIVQSLARYYELWRQWSLRTREEYTEKMVDKNI